jgi:acyl-CoA thioesterase I
MSDTRNDDQERTSATASLSQTTRRAFLGAGVVAVGLPALAAQGADDTSPELDRLKTMLAGSEPITWLFTGDSITHGARHTYGSRSYPEHFAERIRWELDRRRDVVINTGISGDTTGGLLTDLNHRVLRFRPQVFSIMMGMNDAVTGPGGRDAFRTRYDEILGRVRRESSAVLVVHTCNPITSVDKSRQDLPAYVDIIREVARQQKVILVDQDKRWRARNTSLEYLLNDGSVHPNQFGHVLFTHLLCETLGIHDPQSQVGRLFIP